MDFREFLATLRRHVATIVLVTVASVALATVLTLRLEPQYQSSARVFVSAAQAETSAAYAGGLLSEQRVAGYVELVQSKLLARKVQDQLGVVGSLDDLRDSVDASAVGDTAVLEITVTESSAELAQQLAQAYADQLVTTALDIETPPGREDSPIKATIIDSASVQPEAVFPKPALNVGLALVFGVALGVGLALLREILDNTIKTVEDLGPEPLPLMGTIVMEPSAARGELVSELEPTAARAEAFRVLRTNIQFVDIDKPHRSLVVTSALQGEGKTSTAVNLAVSLAQAGVRTLLLDGDLRRSSAARLLGLDDAVGVTTVLLGKTTVAEAIQHHPLTDLDILAAGQAPPNAAELLQSKAMGALLEEVRETYDMVIVDSPPLIPVTDGAILAAHVDGALLVARHGRTTRDQWDTAMARLTSVDARALGVVMNMVPSNRAVLGYSYQPYASRRGRAGRRAG